MAELVDERALKTAQKGACKYVKTLQAPFLLCFMKLHIVHKVHKGYDFFYKVPSIFTTV